MVGHGERKINRYIILFYSQNYSYFQARQLGFKYELIRYPSNSPFFPFPIRGGAFFSGSKLFQKTRCNVHSITLASPNPVLC